MRDQISVANVLENGPGKSTEIDHQSFVKREGDFLECREGHVRMIQAFDAGDQLLFGSQAFGQLGLGESLLLSEFRDAQGKPGGKVFCFKGLLEFGILEILLETISE